MINQRLDLLSDYPFARLRSLLDGVDPPPGVTPLDLSIGEPHHAPPDWINEILARDSDSWNRYPPMAGTAALREEIGRYLSRRYDLPSGFIDPDAHILALAGSREGLYMISQLLVPPEPGNSPPLVLLPNPFYQVYAGGAVMAGAQPVFLEAGPKTGFLPDLEQIDPETADRAVLMFLCSPSNPQGAVADRAYLERALELARTHDFVLACDECYSDLYDQDAPPGLLSLCAQSERGLSGALVFHSLSKRSSAAGLRSGFVAGDPDLIAAFARLRAYGGATLPLPIQAVSQALWRDSAHLVENRARYREKFDVLEKVLGPRFGYRRPQGGFFLWLDVGDGEAAARLLWEKAGLRVLPGAYLARLQGRGANPGEAYIRAAIVDPVAQVKDAAERIVNTL